MTTPPQPPTPPNGGDDEATEVVEPAPGDDANFRPGHNGEDPDAPTTDPTG